MMMGQVNGMKTFFGAMAVVLCLALGLCVTTAQGADTNLLPTPKVIKLAGGDMPLTADSRIVATDPALKPLAEILSQEILALTKMRLAPAEGEAKAGDIVLQINPNLRADEDILTVQKREVVRTRDYAHTIVVSDKAVVEGWDYRAVCEGTASILHLLQEKGGKWSLPKLTIKDWPHADYLGTMIDCVRQDIPIMAVKDAVMAARFWKLRYVHLHLLEDGAFIFPTKLFTPGTSNGGVYGGDTPRVWDLEELKKLVAFADARGVTLVPELETPGHCTAIMYDKPEWFGDPGARMMDIANDNVYTALDKLIGEVCDVFKSSPYFHIGGDEIQFEWYIDKPHVREFMKKQGMREPDKGGREDLLKYHVLRLNEIVKKNGKKTIFWGGWQGPPQIPELNDCIIYSWFAGAKEAQKAGFTTITVPWEIKGPFNEWNVYNSNGEVLDRTKDRVLGHSRPMWEFSAEELTRSWMDGFSERQERTWGPDTPMVLDEFRAREKVSRARMDRIVRPVKMKIEGQITPTGGVFDNSFTGPLTITLTADAPAGCRIHYTVDGTEPAAKSAVYEKPFTHTGRLRLRAALFDESGAIVGGITFSERYNYVSFEKSLSTGKPVETSGGVNENEKPAYAVDGYGDINKFWGTIPAPQWLKVDLQDVYTIDRINILPYWDYKRFYQYTIEVSTDGKEWTEVVDASQNSEAGTDKGYMHKFNPIKARYVKVNMLKNSDNPAVHLVDLRVYEAGK